MTVSQDMPETGTARADTDKLREAIAEARKQQAFIRDPRGDVFGHVRFEQMELLIAAADAALAERRSDPVRDELAEALRALNLAFMGVPFSATAQQLPALKAASEMARAALSKAGVSQ